ncbi:hypothetical protein U9M48_040633 [Paspalum notatum var. saurae]|uniref:Protein FAR1-RELATED SEQUENCE n=1 Tax=Paspalum notatum var. saurae TaxID=547442 RepID=A0AAQ3UQY8_PASNO
MEEVMRKLIYHSLTENEFESCWNRMIEKYNASGNELLQRMFANRKMWVPVHFKDTFCAFIWSSGRSESTNSSLKDYVMRNDTIGTFLEQYEIFQDEQDTVEDKDRFDSNILKPIYTTKKPIKRHAARIYNKGIYLKFVQELLNSDAYSVEEIEKEKKFRVHKLMFYEGEEFDKDSFDVDVDVPSQKYDCICAKFNRDGM